MTRRLNDSERQQVVDHYAKGYSLRETADRYDTSRQTVYSILLRRAPHLIRQAHIGPWMTPQQRLQKCARP